LPGGGQPVVVKQYARFEGVYPVPANVVIHSVTAKVMAGQLARATQTLKL